MNKKTSIIIVLLLLVAISINIYSIFFKEEDKCAEISKDVETKEESKEEKDTKGIIVISPDEDGKYGAIIDADRNLIVNNEIVDTDIIKYEHTVGLGSVCNGNTTYIFLKGDGTISSLYSDDLICGQKVEYVKNVNNLKDVVDITSIVVIDNETGKVHSTRTTAYFKDSTSKEIKDFTK